MTIRRARLTLVLLLVAAPSLAALDKYKDWEKSPENAYLATDDEKKEWKKIASDQEAEKFIALFWARRDPDLKTPENEFRERFEALVKKADELFPLGRRRGALTERGKALILDRPAEVDRAEGRPVSIDAPRWRNRERPWEPGVAPRHGCDRECRRHDDHHAVPLREGPTASVGGHPVARPEISGGYRGSAPSGSSRAAAPPSGSSRRPRRWRS